MKDMKTLKEIYDENRDVRESEIPKDWMPSFEKFMFGSTCYADTNEDGSIKEFVYYACDFRMWYNKNRDAIERDAKIAETLRK